MHNLFFSVTIPCTPIGYALKICPHSGTLHHNFCPGGGDFLGYIPRGWVLVFKQFLQFFEFSL